MKLNGKQPGVHIEPIVLPRPDGDLVFVAKAIEDFDQFDKLCPLPEPPAKILPGNKKTFNFQDQGYLKKVEDHAARRMAYMVVKGLTDGTPTLEWETVKMDDPRTWTSYRDELRQSGLSDIEINRLVAGVMSANSLNERAVDEARQRFLASQQALRNGSLSQMAEVPTLPSGEPASDLA